MNAQVTQSRRIVVCLDGTNNEPGEGRTNVQRIYGMIARIPGEQLTYYQPGVGTLEPFGVRSRLWRRILMTTDAASGWMIKRHVCSAYEYLCEEYRDGDEIYLFGFSRGAQAARILAGMLTAVGLLHPGMREMVPFAWKTYTGWSPFMGAATERDSPEARMRKRGKRDYYRRVDRFKESFSRPVGIRFMGLWDTVSSLGLPWNPQLYNFSVSNSGVAMVRQALSLDERRVNFQPSLFVQNAPHQDVDQVWFPGVHSDVGGGYSGRAADTAKISLAWMLRELAKTGIRFDQRNIDRSKLPDLANPNIVGKAAARSDKDELRKFGWKLMEILPVPHWQFEAGGWRYRLRPHAFAPRRLPPGARIHASVYLRRERVPGYAPSNIPSDAVRVD